MALVGGGGNAFIGRVHAIAATLDNRAELVAGALSSDPEKSRAAAADFGIADDRAYGSYSELIQGESQLSADERVDFISIATPNWTHFDIARAAITAGFHVVCDKPMTIELGHAEELVRLVQRSNLVFALTHNYTGYPMVRQAKQMIRDGQLGEIEAVRANYIQGWLRGLQPGEAPARGAWKADPSKAGPSGAMSDIGTHAFNLIRFTTELASQSLSCKLRTYAPGRKLDDYGHAMIQFANDALGMISVSQVTHGRLNDLTLEIDGTKGSLSWRQEDPNELVVRRFGQPVQVYERNPMAPFTNDLGRAACRLPGGHPESFFEAFATVYRDAMYDMIARENGTNLDRVVYPTVHEGWEGVQFIEKCVASNRDNGAWQPVSQAGSLKSD